MADPATDLAGFGPEPELGACAAPSSQFVAVPATNLVVFGPEPELKTVFEAAPALDSETVRPDLAPVLEHHSLERLYHLDLVEDEDLGRCLVALGKSHHR